MRITHNLNSQLFYLERDESFHIFTFLESHVLQTRIMYSEITEGIERKDYALQLFRDRYLSHAFKPLETDLKIPMASELPSISKLTTTPTGGQGTAGYALIPVTMGSGKPRRCMSCGNIILSNEDRCPACGSAEIEDKGVEIELKKWIGWDFEGTVKWIMMFLEKYKMSQITDVTQEQRMKIKNNLIKSITEGWSLNKLESEIAIVVEDDNRARMIARTEVIRAANEGALLHYEEENIEKVRWIATPSAPGGRTCNRCLEMNGKEFLLKDAKGKIPLHVYCRCTFSPIVEK